MITIGRESDKKIKDEVYRKLIKQSRKVARHRLMRIDDVEDTSQEVFVKLFTNSYNFYNYSLLQKWIDVSTVQKSIDFVRGETCRGRFKTISIDQLMEDNPVLDFPEESPQNIPSLETSTLGEAIIFSMQFLPELYREILQEKLINDLENAEITNPLFANFDGEKKSRFYNRALVELRQVINFFFSVNPNIKEAEPKDLQAFYRVKVLGETRINMPILPIDTHQEILELYNNGKGISQAKIAQQFYVSPTTISCIIAKYK